MVTTAVLAEAHHSEDHCSLADEIHCPLEGEPEERVAATHHQLPAEPDAAQCAHSQAAVAEPDLDAREAHAADVQRALVLQQLR